MCQLTEAGCGAGIVAVLLPPQNVVCDPTTRGVREKQLLFLRNGKPKMIMHQGFINQTIFVRKLRIKAILHLLTIMLLCTESRETIVCFLYRSLLKVSHTIIEYKQFNYLTCIDSHD